MAFMLLGYGSCETLCLADINPQAIEACRRTIRDNSLSDKVSVYLSDNLKSIPSTEQWDIVVSNPIHFADAYPGDILRYDEDWRAHREFFASVGKFLKPNGVVLLQENNWGSTIETFRGMIEDAGLKIILAEDALPERTNGDHIFILGVMRREDTLPEWARGPTPPAPYRIGDIIDFSHKGRPRRFLIRGWSTPESWGTWTSADIAEIGLRVKEQPGPLELIIEARALIGPNRPEQAVEVLVNGNEIGQLTYRNPDAVEQHIVLPSGIVKGPEQDLIVTFRIFSPKSPAELGMSADPRKLGIGVSSIVLKKAVA